ncbi:MAG: hypothetical protein ACOYMB_00575 [Patescibacteria group bacterium]
MHNEIFHSENLKFSEKAEIVRKIREFGLSAENERLALLVAIKETPYAELEFPEGATEALRVIKLLDAFGFYVIIRESEHVSKIIITNNKEDFEIIEKENLRK